MLAFQNSWFQDPMQAYHSRVYQQLIAFSQHINGALESVFLLHTADTKDAEEKFKTYNALLGFYRNKTAEPYLDDQENKLKIDRINQEICHVIKSCPQLAEKLQYYQLFMQIALEDLSVPQIEAILSTATFSADAFYKRGMLYEQGLINNKQPNYEKAAELYKKAGTADAYFRLGDLYIKQHIGMIDNQPDYKTGFKYLALSGQKTALEQTGIAHQKGLIDGQPDYQKASKYLRKADTGYAHFLLAQFCIEGHIGRYSPTPDYEQAQDHLKTCIEKDYMNAWSILGGLYLEGKLGKINGQHDYETAISYLKEAIKASDKVDAHIRADVLFNLGTMYMDGQWNNQHTTPNYLLAQLYLKASGTSEALNNLGHLYSLGLIGHTIDANGTKVINYPQALACYQQSNIPRAKLSMIELYASGHIQTNGVLERERIIDEIIHELSGMLAQLANHERYYVQGAIAYYSNNWEEAVIYWQKALLQGLCIDGFVEFIEELSNRLLDERDIEISNAVSVPAAAKEPLTKEVATKDSAETKVLRNKLTKEQKKQRRMERRKLTSVNSLPDGLTHAKKTVVPHTIELKFLNKRQEEAFGQSHTQDKRLQVLLHDIQYSQWETVGTGKPKVLKRIYKGYKGCLSRRVNQEDRLVYKVIEPGKILILNWQGHYK